MVTSGEKWWIVVNYLLRRQVMVSVAQETTSLRDLAEEVNRALVKAGHADWRREFNARLWACSGDRALSVIKEYRRRVLGLSGYAVSDDLIRQLISRI
jgi:hypothetical protein